MVKSLQEQLQGLGLVDRKQAKRIEHDKRKEARREPRKQAAEASVKSAAAQLAADKAARDRELNRRQQEKAERRARATEIEQLVSAHRSDRVAGEVDYKFVDRGVIRKVWVTPDQHRAIVSGALVVVRFRSRHALVPAGIAAKIRERDPAVVIALPASDGTDASDDPAYAAYKVPDDLMW